MIQFKEEEVCQMVRAITYYRDQVSGSDYMWDQYNDLVSKLYQYGEEVSPDTLECEQDTD